MPTLSELAEQTVYPVVEPHLASEEPLSSCLDLCYMESAHGIVLAVHVRPAWVEMLTYLHQPENYRSHVFRGVSVEQLDNVVRRSLQGIAKVNIDLFRNQGILAYRDIHQYLYNKENTPKVLCQLAPFN